MYQIVLGLHVVIAISVILLVLIQHGKGAAAGAAFNAGASGTVFGSKGTGNFLFKITAALAFSFFVTSLTLSYMVATNFQRAKAEIIPMETPSKASIPVPEDEKTEKKM